MYSNSHTMWHYPQTAENCLSFANRAGFVKNSKSVTKMGISLAEAPDNDVCVTVTPEDGSAKGGYTAARDYIESVKPTYIHTYKATK